MITTIEGIKHVTREAYRVVYLGARHITTIEGTSRSTTYTIHDVREFVTEDQAKELSDTLEPWDDNVEGMV